MNIVILHGWGQSKENWSNAHDLLPNHKVIVFNMPGFGDEPLPQKAWGVPEYADWVAKEVKKRKVKKAVVVGHSFGGRVATEIASANPRWLSGIILTGSPSIYRPSFEIKLRIKIYKTFKKFLPANLRRRFYPTDLKKADSRMLGDIFRKVVPYDQIEQLKKIKIKTLIIWGEKDSEVPIEIGKEMNGLILKSELKIIKNSGHSVHTDNPYLFFGYVNEFIKTI